MLSKVPHPAFKGAFPTEITQSKVKTGNVRMELLTSIPWIEYQLVWSECIRQAKETECTKTGYLGT